MYLNGKNSGKRFECKGRKGEEGCVQYKKKLPLCSKLKQPIRLELIEAF